MIKQRPLPADITDRIQKLESLLINDQRVRFAYLFGELASGERKPLSDVDIAVYLDPAFVTAKQNLKLSDCFLIPCAPTKLTW